MVIELAELKFVFTKLLGSVPANHSKAILQNVSRYLSWNAPSPALPINLIVI